MPRCVYWLPLVLLGCVSCVDAVPMLEEETHELTATPLVSWPAGDDRRFAPDDVVIDSDMHYVYWSRGRSVHRIGTGGLGMLTYCDQCAGETTTHVPIKIAVDDASIYLLMFPMSGGDYIARKAPLAGGALVDLGIAIPNGGRPAAEAPLLVLDGYLYYVAEVGSQNRFFRLPLNGQPREEIDVLTIGFTGLAADTDYIYVGSAGQIFKYARANLAKTLVATSPTAVMNFVVNDRYLYFTLFNGANVQRFDRTLSGVQVPSVVFTDPNVGQRKITSLALSSDGTRIFYSVGDSPLLESVIRVRTSSGITTLHTVAASMWEADDVVWGAKPNLFWGQGNGVWKGQGGGVW